MVILTRVVTLCAMQDTVRSEHMKYALKTLKKSQRKKIVMFLILKDLFRTKNTAVLAEKTPPERADLVDGWSLLIC